ncbi:MAG TPA: hypothetical protein VGR61_04750 [Candidatus Dormibacteraeota bacterium]|nr:hypothetical protein [Candidatus Dormibacteraeota bacterium]
MSNLPPPRPGASPPPPRAGSGGRRVLLLFSIGALVLVFGFLIFAGAAALYFVRNGKAQVTETLPANLPKEIPICTGFQPAHTIIVDVAGGRRYDIQGDCPVNRLQLNDDLINQLEYLGWTVHDDGQGNLSGYSYTRQERLDVGLTDSTGSSNQTTLMIELQTAVKAAPSGFPHFTPSPHPSG